jgi:hypothetical protein
MVTIYRVLSGFDKMYSGEYTESPKRYNKVSGHPVMAAYINKGQMAEFGYALSVKEALALNLAEAERETAAVRRHLAYREKEEARLRALLEKES